VFLLLRRLANVGERITVCSMSLDRFKVAQENAESGFATALAELQAGRKTSHWIWYVFPQLASLGRSETARFYGIVDLAEARAYLADPTLRKRLFAVTEAVAQKLAEGVTLSELMGGATDSQKLVSCLALFRAAAARTSDGVAAEDLKAFEKTTDRILEMAKRQGFVGCEITEQAQKTGGTV
jgi:uncharacterized protein (DUF1810 family)